MEWNLHLNLNLYLPETIYTMWKSEGTEKNQQNRTEKSCRTETEISVVLKNRNRKRYLISVRIPGPLYLPIFL